jgi:hypothetical protein
LKKLTTHTDAGFTGSTTRYDVADTKNTEDPGDGFFKNDKGFPMKRLHRNANGRIYLNLALDGREIEVPRSIIIR